MFCYRKLFSRNKNEKKRRSKKKGKYHRRRASSSSVHSKFSRRSRKSSNKYKDEGESIIEMRHQSNGEKIRKLSKRAHLLSTIENKTGFRTDMETSKNGHMIDATCQRKVSTWLTNYGMKQQLPTSTFDPKQNKWQPNIIYHQYQHNNVDGQYKMDPMKRQYVPVRNVNKYVMGQQTSEKTVPTKVANQQQQQKELHRLTTSETTASSSLSLDNKVKSGTKMKMMKNNTTNGNWPNQLNGREIIDMNTKALTQGSFGGERIGWEYHNITLSRVPVYGFGIAVSGGRDNPHFMNGDPSIAISDVLKAGPAEGKLLVNDRVISANGISLENVDYSQAIHVLRECGNSVNLLIKRRALISSSNPIQTVNHASDPINNNNNCSNNNLLKVTLAKNSKKEDYGIILGCKIYIKEIVNRNSDKENNLQEGDIIHKINNTNAENLTLKEAKKLLDNSKDKVTLVVRRDLNNQNFLNEHGNYINGHSRSSSGISNMFRSKLPPNGFEITNGPSVNKDAIYNSNNETNFPTQSNSYNSNIAVMANSRVSNGWSNQNLYVQPPTRNDSMLNGNQHIDSNSISANRNREPIKDLPFNNLDLTETQTPDNLDISTTSKLSHRPLPQKPSNETSDIMPNSTSDNNNNSLSNENETTIDQELISTKNTKPGEVRYIAFQKEGSVGIRLTGGNEVGIFVTAVQPGSPAYQQGLKVGDKILKANNIDMKDFTREEAVLYLLRIKDRIELFVQNCKEEYENIVAKQKGDSFYIRVHFNYDSEGKGELSFHVGDIFHVVDTLFNGVVGSWFVYRLGRNNQEIQKGSIPNKNRADELAAEQRLENRSKKSSSGTDLNISEGSSRRGNFFKRRRSARRSKSLSKENWEDIVFGDSNSKFSAYERVTLKHPGFVRPVIFFGPLADIAREKLIRDYPHKFESPLALMSNEETKNSKLNHSGIVRLSAIKEIIDQGKHALLDITPSAVDRLNYAQFYPIVIFMRVENKSIVKELRSRSSTKNTIHRSSRKLFEQSIKLEKLWHHIFTSSITLTSGGDLWYKKLGETIDKQQVQTIWMSEFKPEESISDDFLFPMNSISRLSYASSPESDLDISLNESKTDNENEDKNDFIQSNSRITKASSDPSLAQVDEKKSTINPAELVSFDSFGSPNKNKEQSKPEINSMDSNQRSLNNKQQVPLHILLKKELSKNNSDTKGNKFEMDEEKQIENNISEYSTLKIGDRISTNGPNESELYESQNMVNRDSPLPPPPSSTVSSSKIQPQYLETPPRIDRNNKPSRFRSAHERLFGFHTGKNSNTFQMDDADYINTTVLEYSDKSMPNVQKVGNLGDTSSYNSGDSYNKYGTNVEPKNGPCRAGTIQINDPYKFTRSTAQPVSNNVLKQPNLERSKLPPPIPKMVETSYSKTPPSPPPKPILNKMNQSFKYQMNSMIFNDNRQIPRKTYLSNQTFDKQQQQPPMFSDYDNMPPLFSLKIPPKRASTFEMSNGPPGYYQSLPQSFGYQPKEPIQRYSSHTETISNFINGTYNNIEMNPNNFNSMHKDRTTMTYMNTTGDSLNKIPTIMDPNNVGLNKYNFSSNYDNIRYVGASVSGHYMNSNSSSSMSFVPPSNHNTYLNLPFSSKTFENPINYDHNGQPSPLPPPPPLPSYSQTRSNNGTPNIVQPTPQPARSSQYLDLSLNRENRGSAFEVYRKPNIEPSRISAPGSPMFQGLPPPPPPLPVNDFNHINYTNIDEINSSSSIRFAHINGVGGSGKKASSDSIDSNVIATARGVFGSEGGSLVSAETGVSIIIPPHAIPDGVTQEIYFKVCEDKKLAPPLDRNKGETLLSPIVMCGPHGLRFNIPIELRLPHCAIVNPESWSFALKSSDTNNGEPAGWRNISLNNEGDGISGNNFNEQFVSVLVDHF